jgi:hypothetical protein
MMGGNEHTLAKWKVYKFLRLIKNMDFNTNGGRWTRGERMMVTL